MNTFEQIFAPRQEAKIRFGDNTFTVIREGDFVRCAVTGDPIPLRHLRYWNVRLQEAYRSADIATQRYLEINSIRRRSANDG